MISRPHFRLLRLPFAVACIVCVALALVVGRTLPGWDLFSVPVVESQPRDDALPSSLADGASAPLFAMSSSGNLPEPLTAMPSSGNPPEALVAMSSSGGLPVPATATPLPKPPRGPTWVQTRVETKPVPVAASQEKTQMVLPAGSVLKVIREDGGRLLVYLEGERRDKNGWEAWVERGKVSPVGAPPWVMTRLPAPLLADGSPAAPVRASLPERAAMEVLEDSGDMLRVFHLGDGVSSEPMDGWVSLDDLSAAGPTLEAVELGARWLSAADLASLRSGNGLWMKVPFRSQLDGSPAASANCGPSSVAMVLGYFGQDKSTAELRSLAERLQGTPSPDVGVAIEYLYQMVQQFGLKGLDLYAGRGFRQWTLDDVRAHLSRGHPVIPELRYRLMPGRGKFTDLDDHYVVISGMLGDDFIFNDSVDSNGPGPGRLISSDDLMRAWRGSYFPLAGFAVSGP